jgi:predicted phosphodiesterase
MKRAIISDIHGNLEALTAVLKDIDQQSVDEVYCLGDIVGYGPNPCECLTRVMEMHTCILGNHDAAVLSEPADMSQGVLRAILWTRLQLKKNIGKSAFAYISELPRVRREKKFMFVHGSPCEPTNEYVFRMDIHNKRKMDALFDRVDRYCFQGHTHVPGVFTRDRFIGLEDCDYDYPLGQEKLMINVGSVGQPRDGDPRACYAIVTDEQVVFRRVEYSVGETAEKIQAISDLDDSFGERLLSGE